MKYFFSLTLLASAFSTHALAHDIRVNNYIDDFILFYDQTNDMPFNQKVLKWDEYTSVNKPLFSRVLYMRVNKKDSLKKAFARFPREIKKIKKLNKTLHKIVAQEINSYKSLFPNVKLKFDFYFAVCDFGFGGMVNEIKGRPAIVTCVEQAQGLESNLSHELAHAFHHQVNPDIAKDRSMAAIVLKEGFAVYCNIEKYKTSLEQEVWGEKVPKGGIKAVDRRLAHLMKELLADLEKTDKPTRVKWLGWSRKHALVPKAGGYYLGYKILQDLLGSMSIQEVINLSGPKLRAAMRQVIENQLSSRWGG